jgi:hypothetical protein
MMRLMEQEKFCPFYHGQLPIFSVYSDSVQFFIWQVCYYFENRFPVGGQDFKKMLCVVISPGFKIRIVFRFIGVKKWVVLV